MNKITVFFAFCLLWLNAPAQEQLGLRTGAYSGVHALLLNPASTVGMPLKWDVNLAEAAAFAQTNYAFIYQGGLSAFRKTRQGLTIVSTEDAAPENSGQRGRFVGDFTENKQKKHFSLLASATGPSFFFRLPGGTSLGFISRMRFMAGIYGLPSTLDYNTYETRPLYEPFSVTPFHSALMAWNEWGLHIGHEWETSYGFFGFGLTGKYLQAYEAAYFSNLSTTEISKLPGDSLLSLSADLSYGLTTTAFEHDTYTPRQTGSGWGIDVGVQWTIEGQYDLYDWKFGLALLDLGKAQFTRHAQQHRIQVEGQTLIIDKDTLSNFQRPDFIEVTIRGFSRQVLQDQNASLRGNAFDFWLPAALSLQAEACLYDGFFIQAQLVQRLPLRPGAIRGNLLAITPRYEQKYWGIWLPLSLYNYKEMQLGLALKAGPLILGTERLASLFRTARWDGFDFYMALKVPPFSLKLAPKLKTGRRSKGRGPRCYKF